MVDRSAGLRCLALLFLLLAPGLALAARNDNEAVPSGSPPAGEARENRITRQGMTIEFSARPVGGKGDLREEDYADVTFRITDAGTGQPVRALAPGAWMDIGQSLAGHEKAPLDCRQKMSLFLSGRVGIRPMIDLNSYFVLALNRDSSISVVDPMVGMAGKTYLYAHIPLPRPGADWAKTADDNRLFVTLPRAGRLAVVNTESFKVAGGVDVGGVPVRIAMQRDGKYLWVGDESTEAGRSGVVVVDPAKLAVAGRISTGRGRHEIAFSDDDRYAFVGNREDGTVSVIEVGKLAKIKDVKTGPQPASLAYSRQGRAIYVTDGRSGEIAVIDAVRHEVAARIPAKPGIGEIRFTDDGRFALAVNPEQNAVYVVSASENRIVHTIAVDGRPSQLVFTKAFAYIRSLDSDRVTMIPLSELGRDQAPQGIAFPTGDSAPGTVSPGIAVAGQMSPALGEAAVMVANPADGNIYYYMEGMVAPMATFRNYGHRPEALTVVNRSFKETEPGVYKATARLPASGKYDVGFILTSPQIVHCFAAEVNANPDLPRTGPALAVEYLLKDRRVRAGGDLAVRLRLTDAATGKPRAGLADVRLLYYMAPGQNRKQAAGREVGEGIYEFSLSVQEAGAYYVYVAVPSEKVDFKDLTRLSIIAETEPGPARGRGKP
ncbi:MAG: YncE family protein [Deltaproteobacteria bacterium]|nr:YncE family protein [Deltaproteobacteria bacterium]